MPPLSNAAVPTWRIIVLVSAQGETPVDLATVGRLFELRRYAEAEEAARALVAASPDSPPAHRLLARALNGLGRGEEALVHARTACRLSPDQASSWLILSQCHRAVGDRREAIEAAQECVRLGPHDWTTHYTLAHAHLMSPVAPGARSALDAVAEAVRLAPANPEIHNMRGMALARAGRTDEARAAYERALELDPHHTHALNNLGALDARRRPVRAARRLSAAASLDPQRELFRNNIGVVAGNILTRLMQALIVAGMVIALARILGAPLWVRLVLVAVTAVAFGVGLHRATRSLPRGLRRSPRLLWRNLSPRARWFLSRASAIVVLDLVIALAPVGVAVAAWVGLLAVRLLPLWRRPPAR
jgi:Flp pilus assembly protein TadD